MESKVIATTFNQFIGETFLNYAMSVITDRALGDARDGLKPVHRRILQTMSEAKLWHTANYRKSARTVGTTMGLYHPHGDSSIYGGLVTLAQDFSMRYPLIDGHGNFGDLDYNPAAAMRYTEARLSIYGELMVENMGYNTCDYTKNFDETADEAVFLPTLFPNVIVNGATEGIAVGMASHMISHNLTETYNALIACIDAQMENKDISAEFLLKYMQGPDLPLGGKIVGRKGIFDYFSTGKGKLTIRSTYDTTTTKKETIITVSQLPYKVNKEKLVERIDELKDTKIKDIKTVEDNTDLKRIKIDIFLKRDANVKTVINKLCKYSDFEIAYTVNNNLLFDKQPIVASMPQVVNYFIEHAYRVVARKLTYQLDKLLRKRLHHETLLWVIENSETILPIVRESQSAESLYDVLSAYLEDVTKEQATIIEEVKMRQLSIASYEKYQRELLVINNEIERLEAILNDHTLLAKTTRDIFVEMRDKYGDSRRTEILPDEKCIDVEELIDEEDLIITYTTDNLIKSMLASDFRTTKRGAKGVGSGLNEDDSLLYLLSVSNKDSLFFFTSLGKCHIVKAYEVPKFGRTSKGRSIYNLLELQENERVVNVINMEKQNDKDCLVFATQKGIVKKLMISQLSSVRSTTKVITFKDDDELVSVNLANANQDFIMCTAQGYALKFNLEQVRATGRSSSGCTGIRFKNEKDCVVSAIPGSEEHKLLTITESGYGKITEFNALRLASRGGKGVICQNTNAGLLSCVLSVSKDITKLNEVIMATQNGQMICIHTDQIRKCGRNAKGVKLANVQSKDRIISASIKQSEVIDDAE